MRVPISDQFPVYLRDSAEALFPSLEELRKRGIDAGGSRTGLLFRKGATPQPARNGSVTDPDLGSDGRLREALLAQGDHLLVVSQTLLSFCLYSRATFFGSTCGDS